jgi:hypothetical protein
MVLGPTQPPIQWVPGAFSLGVKRPGREGDHSAASSAEVKECVELYLDSPNTPSWRGAQLKSTGTTLPLPYWKNPKFWNNKLVISSSSQNKRVSISCGKFQILQEGTKLECQN